MPDLSPEAEHIAQVIAAWNMQQAMTKPANDPHTDYCWSIRQWGRLCVHQIRELAEWLVAKKEKA